MDDALKRFTLRRMRSSFGDGVSIPSQLRWVRYVDTWTKKLHKKSVERPVEIVEIHVWGLRSGVKVCVEGFIEEGMRIKNFHTFKREEKIVVDNDLNRIPAKEPPTKRTTETIVPSEAATPTSSKSDLSDSKEAQQNVILRPLQPIRLETSDVNIDFERRNKSGYTGFTMVTSIAHVWFNTFFEGGSNKDSGVFEIEWAAMDGIKGSARKGIQALDRLKVIWKYPDSGISQPVDEPQPGEPIKEGKPCDWRGNGDPEKDIEAKNTEGVASGRPGGAALTLSEMTSEAIKKLSGKDIGLRESDTGSVDISRASSVKDESLEEPATKKDINEGDNEHGVKSDVYADEGENHDSNATHESHDHERQDTTTGKYLEMGIARLSSILGKK